MQKAYRPGPIRARRPFIWVYDLSEHGSTTAAVFDDVTQFEQAQSAKGRAKQEMVFLCGQASPEWLNSVGSLYQLDPEVLFQHMTFFPSAERESYFDPGVRSAAANTLRLCIPTIVTIDPKSRHVSRDELYAARRDIDSSLRKKFNQLKNAPHSDAGLPFFRRVNVHTGDLLTTEQEISITLLIHDEKHADTHVQRGSVVSTDRNPRSFTVLVWTDSNGDGAMAKIPLPGTPSFSKDNLVTSFCPVILDRSHAAVQHQALKKVDMRNRKKSQTLSFLPSHYELDLRKAAASAHPFTATHGLFKFAACAVSQFLEMLSIIIDVQLEQFRKPPNEVSEYPDAMTFHYSRTVLERCRTQLDDATEDLRNHGGPSWVSLETEPASSSVEVQIDSDTMQLMRDYRKLSRKVQYLVLKCDQGLDVVKDYEAANKARRANEQNDSLSMLTQITTIVTILYVPLSFVTSVFGMNFRQFGQGELSIWWWGAFSGPIVFASLILLTWISPGMQAVALDVKLSVSQKYDLLSRKAEYLFTA